MTRITAHQRRRQRELDEARARLVAHLQEVIGPEMTSEAAQSALEHTRAWSSIPARQLDDHLAENPDALTNPSPHCPAVLIRLLRHLDATGHGDAVTQPRCARCGDTRRQLTRTTEDGRCCGWCVDRDRLVECARCHEKRHPVARREEGAICRICYSKDPLALEECGTCGKQRLPSRRLENGTALCSVCAPRPLRQCVRCGKPGVTWSNGEDGPVCRHCYEPPARLCGVCGLVRPIVLRAADGHPDTCADCYRGPLGDCSKCGRHRHGGHVTERGGAFLCNSCHPRPIRRCEDCGESKPVQATWPVGALCGGCYSSRRRHPKQCSRCDVTRILVGRTEDGLDLCGPCCGRDDLDAACRRCGFPGDIYTDGSCTRCVMNDRVQDLLRREDGTISPQLHPLLQTLADVDNPWSLRSWLRNSDGPRILAQLALQEGEITHDTVDNLPQDAAARHVREILVVAGVLPRRQENFARLELWLAATLTPLPPHQKKIIRPFAEWHVVRDARRRAARGHYTFAAAAADRTDIRVAIKFLTWLDANQIDLDAVAQEDVDLWLTANPTRHRGIGSFIRWAVARKVTGKITVAPRPSAAPTQFQGDQEYDEQLRRCLNDDTLPNEVRIIGALVRLYALPVSRIVELTTDRFLKDKDGSYFTFDKNPVLLPPKLARLIETQVSRPSSTSMLSQTLVDGHGFLLPGRPPSRPRSPASVHRLMKQHGLPVIHARNSAMLEAVGDLPPIVIADLFGVAPSTAHRWAQYAQDSWSDYLAACKETKETGAIVHG